MARNDGNTRSAARSIPLSWVSRYVGIPFLDQGRDAYGCDCWGLVRLIYKNELNIDLPAYGEISAVDLAKVARNITEGYNGETWEAVDVPQPLDVVVMRFHGSKHIGHVGVMVNDTDLIHTERRIDAAIVPLSHMTIRTRIVCFRRHKEMMV